MPPRRIKQFVSVDWGVILKTLHNSSREGKEEKLHFLAFRGILYTQSVITYLEIYARS